MEHKQKEQCVKHQKKTYDCVLKAKRNAIWPPNVLFVQILFVFKIEPPNKHMENNTASGAIETEFAMVESWDRTKNKHRINTEWTKNKQRINKE